MIKEKKKGAWAKKMELEEKRRKADQEHEYRMIQLLMQQRGPLPQNYQSNPYDFVNDTTF